MSFFHRPGDSSSDEDSSEGEPELETPLNDVSQNSDKLSTGTVEELDIEDTTETLSIIKTTSDITEDRHHVDRDLMMATILEDLALYKAIELLNNSNVGETQPFTKDSPEVKEAARKFFTQSSDILTKVGVMSIDAASESNKSERVKYLAALERANIEYAQQPLDGFDPTIDILRDGTAVVHRNEQQPILLQHSAIAEAQQRSWEMQALQVMRRPSSELQLVSPRSSPRLHSHYRKTFEERGMLGRGGFGKVYHTYNLFDNQEYAVKKIPLSPKLSQRYHQRGFLELKKILKEVQALARLEHCNIVRYFSAWIEEPYTTVETVRVMPLLSSKGQMMIDDGLASARITTAGSSLGAMRHNNSQFLLNGTRNLKFLPDVREPGPKKAEQVKIDLFDPFARSYREDDESKPLWSSERPISSSQNQGDDTDPFSDGLPPCLGRSIDHSEDSSVYVVHVQMAIYPSTLTHYLSPITSPQKGPVVKGKRHCFHLVPGLRLLLGVLCGLQYIHSQGYLHRDIKPGNIFLSEVDDKNSSSVNIDQGYVDVGSCSGCENSVPYFVNPRIGDFGLVADLEKAAGLEPGVPYGTGSEVDSGRVIGTQFYRPPLHAYGSMSDEKVDIFALGVILLELLHCCSTRMERITLLQGCHKGDLPAGMLENLQSQGFNENIISMVEACMFGMIDPNPKTRWSGATVKNGIENILKQIASGGTGS